MKNLYTKAIFSIILMQFLFLLFFPIKCEANTKNSTDKIIFIDLNERSLSLIDKSRKKTIKKYPIAIGKLTTPSPFGQFKITSKALKDGPFGGYWLGLNVPWDTIGIHGTTNPGSIGNTASNGCFRLYNHNIKELFNLVEYDTTVIISPGPTWRFSLYNRVIKPNDRGGDVYLVQQRLANLGYFKHTINGIYEYSLEIALLKYERDFDLPLKKEIDDKLLDHLQLYKFE